MSIVGTTNIYLSRESELMNIEIASFSGDEVQGAISNQRKRWRFLCSCESDSQRHSE
jgi:hypothetical protein